jgi:hypothetical protein
MIFHGSDKDGWSVGDILRPRRSGFVHSRRPSIRTTEAILEASRRRVAPGALARGRCVFAVAAGNPLEAKLAGGHQAVLLGCTPLDGEPERSCVGWWSAVNMFHNSVRSEILEGWAEAYWLGAPLDLARIGEEAGQDTSRFSGLVDVWELRCHGLQVEEVRAPACGPLGGVSAPLGSEAATTLARFGHLESREGAVILQCKNDIWAARALRGWLTALEAPPSGEPDDEPGPACRL